MSNYIDGIRKEWFNMDISDPRDYAIQKIVAQLDEVFIKYESKWGIDFLQTNCSGELLQKWQVQCAKFEDAVKTKHVDNVTSLAIGFKRAFEALENDVLAQGHKTKEASYMSYKTESGQTIIIAVNNQDYSMLKILYKDSDDVLIWTLSEVANILEGKTLLNVIAAKKVISGDVNVDIDFNFKEGDEIPF